MLQHATAVHLSASDKIGEAIRRSLVHLPAEARSSAQSLLHPHSLAIIAGTLSDGYAQLRVYGLASALQAIRFPLQGDMSRFHNSVPKTALSERLCLAEHFSVFQFLRERSHD